MVYVREVEKHDFNVQIKKSLLSSTMCVSTVANVLIFMKSEVTELEMWQLLGLKS